jgi:N-acyl-phosphatidylethanolamine-hydrolysing phospholipase D
MERNRIGRRKFLKRAAAWGLGTGATLTGCGRFGADPPVDAEIPTPEAEGLISREASSLYLAHGKPGAWYNPWWKAPHRLGGLLKWKLLYRNPYLEAKANPPQVSQVANDGAYLAKPEKSASITWVGHCTFVVKDGPDTFVTDPHFGPRAFWYNRLHPPGVSLDKIPGDAFFLLSHNHYDHMDAWTAENAPKSVKWYVPMGLGPWFRDQGIRVQEMDWWQSIRHGRWKITCLPAQHWSNRLWMGRNATLWCAYLVESAERKFFFGGDSGYFHGYEEFGKKFGPIDAAMLPIGAFEPRWFMRFAHMNPAEAWRATYDLRARWLFPMHWGTFDLTDEPLDEAPKVLRQAVAKAGGDINRVKFMAVGERWHMPK